MTNYKIVIKEKMRVVASFFFLLILIFSIPNSSAQTANGQVVITWQANNYFPASFTGKSLPAPHTEIVVSVEFIKNNKLVDISGADIRWFVDDEFLRSGAGLKTVSFYAGQGDDDYASVRANVVTKEGTFQGSMQIPVVPPEIVISYKSPANAVKPDSQITLEAIPYSFSIRSLNDLAFFWSVNGDRIDTRSGVLTLDVGRPQTASQKTIQISVSAQNNLNPLEIAKTLLMLPLESSR